MCLIGVRCNMFISFIGMILGFAAFICFAFIYHNYAAGVLGLCSGLLAMITFHLHRLKSKGVLREWYSIEMFDNMELLGMVGFLIGGAMTVWYIFVQVYYDCSLMPVDKSVVIRLVWSFMTLKWGLLLFVHARKYSHMSD